MQPSEQSARPYASTSSDWKLNLGAAAWTKGHGVAFATEIDRGWKGSSVGLPTQSLLVS